MTRPSVGELLAGLRLGLERGVLPAVSDGAAIRQLKAALTLLARLERTWDRWAPVQAADLQDMREAIGRIAERASQSDGDTARAARAAAASLQAGSGPLDRGASSQPRDVHGAHDARNPQDAHDALARTVASLEAAVRGDRGLDAGLRAELLGRFADLHRRMLMRQAYALGQTVDAEATPLADGGPGLR